MPDSFCAKTSLQTHSDFWKAAQHYSPSLALRWSRESALGLIPSRAKSGSGWGQRARSPPSSCAGGCDRQLSVALQTPNSGRGFPQIASQCPRSRPSFNPPPPQTGAPAWPGESSVPPTHTPKACCGGRRPGTSESLQLNPLPSKPQAELGRSQCPARPRHGPHSPRFPQPQRAPGITGIPARCAVGRAAARDRFRALPARPYPLVRSPGLGLALLGPRLRRGLLPPVEGGCGREAGARRALPGGAALRAAPEPVPLPAGCP